MRLICLGMHSAKKYFCLGGFGVGFYLNKDGQGPGSKFQTDFFFFNVLIDSLNLLENVKKCILIYFKWTAASLKNSDGNYRRLFILWMPKTWGNHVAWTYSTFSFLIMDNVLFCQGAKHVNWLHKSNNGNGSISTGHIKYPIYTVSNIQSIFK